MDVNLWLLIRKIIAISGSKLRANERRKPDTKRQRKTVVPCSHGVFPRNLGRGFPLGFPNHDSLSCYCSVAVKHNLPKTYGG